MPQKTHVMIVEACFHKDIADHLANGARHALEQAGATYECFAVPGALEIPAIIALGAESGKFDAYVALGCVIRSNNYHFEVVCDESARSLGELAIKNHLPIGNGILTVESYAQALERADPAQKNRGADAANAALAVLDIKRRIKAQSS